MVFSTFHAVLQCWLCWWYENLASSASLDVHSFEALINHLCYEPNTNSPTLTSMKKSTSNIGSKDFTTILQKYSFTRQQRQQFFKFLTKGSCCFSKTFPRCNRITKVTEAQERSETPYSYPQKPGINFFFLSGIFLAVDIWWI